MKLSWELSRRDFMVAALVVAACGGDDDSSGKPKTDGGAGAGGAGGADGGTGPRVPFGVWEEVRAALRTSPDHLPARADALVAGKDAKALYEFVRDQIVTLPANLTTLGGETPRLFGVRGTLRGGAGSMRDKADLLVELYKRAGLEAEVVAVSTPKTADFVKTVLIRSVSRVFDPQVSDQKVSEWLSLLKIAPSTVKEVLDPDNAAATALAQALLAQLPADAKAQGFDFSPPISIPIVRVTVAGEKKLANPALPDLAFGESGSAGNPSKVAAAQTLPKLTATLSIVSSAEPKVPVDLVSGEFEVEALPGRSLRIGMVPPEGLAQIATLPLDQLRTFIPVLSLDGPDLTKAERDQHTFVGSALTRSGDVIAKGSDGSYSVGGVPLDTSPLDPAKAASVKTLTLGISESGFPRVTLRAGAVDASGNSVHGLSASAFLLEEEGAERAFSLLENKPAAPRVVFVLDKSTSLPPEFSGAQAAALVKTIATQLLAKFTDASFRIHTVGGSANDGAWTSDPAVLEQAALNQYAWGSDLWEALSDAAKLAGTVLIFITDGDATDTPDAEALAAVSTAPPSVMVHVGTFPTTTLDLMAKITGGTVVSVTMQSQAIAAADQFIVARQKNSYLLRYEAPLAGPSTRKVQLSIRSGTASAIGQYTVPAPADIKPPKRFGGLLLTLDIGSETITRVLAGRQEVLADTVESVFAEVDDAFFGSFELRFEAGAPTAAQVADDLITARLGLEPLWDATRGSDLSAIYDALVQSPAMPALGAFALHAPVIAEAGALVYPTGLRAALHSVMPRGKKSVVRRVDMLPLSPYAAVNADGRAALTQAMNATARFALIESTLFAKSTQSLLKGIPLVLVPKFQDITNVVSGLTPELIERWRLATRGYTNSFRVASSTGLPVAFWHVDPDTGALLGVLENGSGGAEEAEAFQTEMNNLIDLINRLANLAGATGALSTAGGVWLSLELTKAKKLLGATVVIAGGTSSDDPTNWNDFGCAAASGAAGGAFGGMSGLGGLAGLIGQLGEALGKADNVMGAATGHSPICG